MATTSQVAIVTGGNSGMGMGITRRLVEKGWKVAVADINENQKFADELGDAASFHKCDVADYDRYLSYCVSETLLRCSQPSRDVPTSMAETWAN